MFQKFSWTDSSLLVKDIDYGKGIFTTRPIQSGELLIMFGGYVLTTKEFMALSPELQKTPYQVSDNLFFGQMSAVELSTADYLNHSCEPNCGFNGQMAVVAMRNIQSGEQITIDYATCTSSPLLEDVVCGCETKNCRGTTRHNDWENPELQKKYWGYFQPYLQDKIAKRE